MILNYVQGQTQQMPHNNTQYPEQQRDLHQGHNSDKFCKKNEICAVIYRPRVADDRYMSIKYPFRITCSL